MEIYMSAGIHGNPVHRKRLRHWLENLKKTQGDPEFLAVEANRVLFEAVMLSQRREFFPLARKDCVMKKIHKTLLDKLAASISYEADTHSNPCDVFGAHTQIVWLDDVRKNYSNTNPCSTARIHLGFCRSAVIKSSLEVTDSLKEHQLFEAVDSYFLEKLDNEVACCDRDIAWMEHLEPLLFNARGSAYGIVVVGAAHTRDEPDFLRYLLGKSGHDCNVHDLSKILPKN